MPSNVDSQNRYLQASIGNFNSNMLDNLCYTGYHHKASNFIKITECLSVEFDYLTEYGFQVSKDYHA